MEHFAEMGRQPTNGDTVTIRKTASDGRVLQEYPATFVRVTRDGWFRCRETEHGTYCDYPPREVASARLTGPPAV